MQTGDRPTNRRAAVTRQRAAVRRPLGGSACGHRARRWLLQTGDRHKNRRAAFTRQRAAVRRPLGGSARGTVSGGGAVKPMRHGADNYRLEIRGENPPQSDQTGRFLIGFQMSCPEACRVHESYKFPCQHCAGGGSVDSCSAPAPIPPRPASDGTDQRRQLGDSCHFGTHLDGRRRRGWRQYPPIPTNTNQYPPTNGRQYPFQSMRTRVAGKRR